MNKEALTPQKRSASEDLKKARNRMQKMLELSLGDGVFHLKEVDKLRYFGRDKEEGGILDDLKEDISCGWGTIKKYVIVMGSFVKFLKVDPQMNKAVSPQAVSAIDAAQAGVLKTVSKLATEERQGKKEELQPIPDALIRKYLDSTCVKEVLRTLGKVAANTVISSQFYNEARNHLLLILTLTNGKRPGVFGNLQKVKLAKAKIQNGFYVVYVKEHKTLLSGGHARIVLAPSLFKALKVFVDIVCNSLPRQSRYVFMTQNGDHMRSPVVNKAIQSAWKQWQASANIKAPHMTAGCVRKSIVTISRDSGNFTEAQLKELANHMDHSFDTANKFYSLSDGAKVSERAAQFIRTMFEIDVDDLKDGNDDDDDALSSDEGDGEDAVEEKPKKKAKKKEKARESTPEMKASRDREKHRWSDLPNQNSSQRCCSTKCSFSPTQTNVP